MSTKRDATRAHADARLRDRPAPPPPDAKMTMTIASRLSPARVFLLLVALCALFGASLPVALASDDDGGDERGSSSAEAESSATTDDADAGRPDFKKMKIKELRAILDDRGAVCRGCAEKADYVERAAEVWDLPIVDKTDESDADDAKTTTRPPRQPHEPDVNLDPEQQKRSDEEIEKLMAQMRGEQKPTGDPERDAILAKLRKNGLSFAGGMDTMPIEQLRNLADSLGNIKASKPPKGEKAEKDDL
jgi:hypothetical protein